MQPLLFLIFISFLDLFDGKGISSSIPLQLAPCYRKNYTSKLLKPPMNIRLLVELIRTFENHEKDSLNMRVFTTSLMHSVRYDGIVETPGFVETEFSIPYRATGQPFYKYKLLVDYLISGQPQLIPENSITTRELCLLHEIISSRIQIYSHDTHPHMCPREVSYQSVIESSECHVESGIVNSKWGLISPGHLVAGVAAALQETSLNIQDLLKSIKTDCIEPLNYTQYTGTINNIWMATITGDLGEITLQQAFQPPKIGTPGVWDNKLLPRVHYLQDKYHEMTSAELLGAIDGAIIANKANEWISILSRTRFSQLIDMYYSKRGIAYDKSYRACNRKAHLNKILQEQEYNLAEQTYKAANVLREIGASSKIFPQDALFTYAHPVIQEFTKQAAITMLEHNDCNLETYNIQPLELLVLLDESWNAEQVQIFIGVLADAIDLGTYGSSMGLINQKSGYWLTNVTDSIVQLYDEIESSKNSWQLPLRLSKGLGSVVNYLRKKTWTRCETINKIPRTTVLLVLANVAVLSDDDLYFSKEVLKAAKNDYPETVVIYLTSTTNSNSYSVLSALYVNDVVIETTETHQNAIPQIMEALSKIPNRIMDYSCNKSEVYMEDYVTPEVTKVYEIHKEYIKRADFFVKFKGYDYGQASVCIYDTGSPHNRECKGLGGNEEINYLPRRYCLNIYNCSIQFSVTVTKSNLKCSEFDCRYPDQMRIEITTRTNTNRSGSTTICFNIYAVVVLLGICLNFL